MPFRFMQQVVQLVKFGPIENTVVDFIARIDDEKGLVQLSRDKHCWFDVSTGVLDGQASMSIESRIVPMEPVD